MSDRPAFLDAKTSEQSSRNHLAMDRPLSELAHAMRAITLLSDRLLHPNDGNVQIDIEDALSLDWMIRSAADRVTDLQKLYSAD